MKLLLFLLAIASLLSAQTQIGLASKLDISNLQNVYSKEYYPLGNGDGRIYDSPVGEAEMEVEKVDTGYSINYSGLGVDYTQTLRYQGDSLYITKTQNEVFFFGTTITYGEPMLKIPFPLTDSSKWSWQGDQIIDEDTTTIILSGSVAGMDSVQTEIGSYNCLKLYFEINSGQYTDRVTEWLAPGIGIVKSEAIIDGGGFTGFLQNLLGLDKIVFKLLKT